jgi:YD repeat-containing protein
LGNLRKTIQGEQSRYFMHDSLGRLLFAKQPEQQTNAAFVATDAITTNTNWSVKYEYDDNGNITRTTDARGVYVQGTYDKLDRLIIRDYSDATPDGIGDSSRILKRQDDKSIFVGVGDQIHQL